MKIEFETKQSPGGDTILKINCTRALRPSTTEKSSHFLIYKLKLDKNFVLRLKFSYEKAYYRDVVLSQLLTDMKNASGEYYIFQQDSAPAHRARDTIALLQRETPAFIPPDVWPPNSPDLNPVDYKIWSVMQHRVYRKKVEDVADLRGRLIEVWAGMEQINIDDAIDQWRRRLRACVGAKGGHFEHSF